MLPKATHLDLRRLEFLAKLLIGGLLLWILSKQVTDWNLLFPQFLKRIETTEGGWLFFCMLFLMPVNWACEGLKWYFFCKPYFPIRIGQVCRGILAGLTVSILTPNRTGEFLGRVVVLPEEFRGIGVLGTLVGSVAQLIFLLGIGAACFLGLCLGQGFLSGTTFQVLALLLGILILSAGYAFLHPQPYLKPVLRIPWVARRFPAAFAASGPDVNKMQMAAVLLTAGVRYTIYIGQFILCLLFNGARMTTEQAFLATGSMYFIQSGIPLPPVIQFIARGELAIQLFGFYGVNAAQCLMSVFLVWLVNVGVPSLIGFGILAGQQFFKR